MSAVPRNGMTVTDRLIESLPSIYREEASSNSEGDGSVSFTRRFLSIFGDVLEPIERTIDYLPDYFDPLLAPEGLIDWLASWLDIDLDSRLPRERRRRLLARAIQLHNWRGTKKGLEDLLEVCLGVRPVVDDLFGPVSQNAPADAESERRSACTVTFGLEAGGELDEDLARTLIQAHKPAYLAYELRVEQQARSTEARDV